MKSSDAACAPPVLLTGPILGGVVGALLCVTTFLYLNHDRERKEWVVATQQGVGHWPPPTSDFNWCEPDYAYTPWIAELWNTLTSLLFLVEPALLWNTCEALPVKLNLLLVVAIGLGSAAFHATLQYEAQLLDELPMILYIVHTVALLSRADVSCPRWLWLCGAALSVVLFATTREHAAHKACRVVMVLGFSGCFLWLAFSGAPLCSQLDEKCAGYRYTRRYQYTALTVVVAILAWVTDNLGCRELHGIPFGLPYPQLHATMWHTGMAFVCGSLCHLVVGKQQQYARAGANVKSE